MREYAAHTPVTGMNRETEKEASREIDWLLVVVFFATSFLSSAQALLFVGFLLFVEIILDWRNFILPGKAMVPILLLMALGITTGISNGYERTDFHAFVRDIAYYVAPLIYILFSYNRGRQEANSNRLITTLFIATSAVTVVSLVIAGISGDLSTITDRNATFSDIANARVGNYLVLYPPACFFAGTDVWPWRAKHRVLTNFLMIITLGVAIFAVSRITVVCYIVFFLVLGLRNAKIAKRTLQIFIAVLVITAIALVVLPKSVTSYFIEKIQNSVLELSANRTIWSSTDIVQNWRGYEVYCARNQIAAGDTTDRLFGFGFGSLVNMGGFEYLVTGEVGGLPVLHNGYWTVLFKCGIVGLVVYLYLLIAILADRIRDGKRRDSFIRRLGLAIWLSIIVATYAIMGIFALNAMTAFLIPAMLTAGFVSHTASTDCETVRKDC